MNLNRLKYFLIKYKIKSKIFNKNTIIIVFMLIAAILYYFSLTCFKLTKGENFLKKDGIKFYYQRVIQCSISALITSIIFLLVIKKKLINILQFFNFFLFNFSIIKEVI
jgi:hypothetical protein